MEPSALFFRVASTGRDHSGFDSFATVAPGVAVGIIGLTNINDTILVQENAQAVFFVPGATHFESGVGDAIFDPILDENNSGADVHGEIANGWNPGEFVGIVPPAAKSFELGKDGPED